MPSNETVPVRRFTSVDPPTHNFYDAVGCPVDMGGPVLDSKAPDKATIRERWRLKVHSEHPSEHDESSQEHQRCRWWHLMAAYTVLMGPKRADYDDLTHQPFIDAHGIDGDGTLPQDWYERDCPDWSVVLLEDVLKEVSERIGEFDHDNGKLTEEGYKEARSAMLAGGVNKLPKTMAGERLASIPELDVGAMIDELVSNYPDELEAIRETSVTTRSVVWQWKAGDRFTFRGRKVALKSRSLSQTDRARIPGPERSKPTGEIALALKPWLLMSKDERRLQLFRALKRFENVSGTLRVVAADVETSIDEVRIFGVQDKAQAELLVAALRHEKTPEALVRHELIESTQLDLFGRTRTALIEDVQQTLA